MLTDAGHLADPADAASGPPAGAVIALDLVEGRLGPQGAASRAESEFLFRISHKMATPLSVILGFGELLELSELPEPEAEYVGRVVESAKDLVELVNAVREVARIKSGRPPTSIGPTAVTPLVEESVTRLAGVAGRKGVAIISAELDGPTYAAADPAHLEQVIETLVSNAVKYNSAGGTATVSVRSDGDRVAIEVADTGPGIEPGRLDRLFVPFERLGVEAGDGHGAGMSLVLAGHLVELMGGTVVVQSEPGAGSTFTVYLPATAPPSADQRSSRPTIGP
jgi:signal transduction histidine kinase